MKKLNIAKARPLIRMAIEEDLGAGDVTSELLFKEGAVAKANIISREEIVICGMDVVREILKCYSDAILIKVDIPTGDLRMQSGEPEPEYVDAARDARNKLHEIVCHLESQCIEKGHHFAAGFIGGPCPLCDTCVGAKSGLPCRHPFKARPAMEAMGIDVMSTVEKAGLHLSFGRNEGRSWIGLVLLA